MFLLQEAVDFPRFYQNLFIGDNLKNTTCCTAVLLHSLQLDELDPLRRRRQR